MIDNELKNAEHKLLLIFTIFVKLILNFEILKMHISFLMKKLLNLSAGGSGLDGTKSCAFADKFDSIIANVAKFQFWKI